MCFSSASLVGKVCDLFHSLRDLICVLAILVAGAAQADSWDEAIAKVERSAAEYFDYAVEVGGTSWAGTMYNGDLIPANWTV